ncbi:DJ-1/PfpI family protein [Paenibacillus glycinis]|uniref:DJ-1/PfpI family protein n=1 Tax=Paenibacillus glycinis TaxID=2697035 RepID=A0ABW9XRI8_9BACL|nr:DJ-1/PfpI family protein [Paenibacillus glycinis]NBD25253.1 DJ-1/PfpI family protein [Paenibacillus glycinis]
MKIAFIMFDGMTLLDFSGFYEAVTWMKLLGADEGLSWDFCADKAQITDDRGLSMNIARVKPDLSGYDLVFVPGGWPTRRLRFDEAYVAWLRTAENARYKASVCTGALLLGAAGFLRGRRATTNVSACELLAPYCGEVVLERCVRDGDVFTGGGVSSSLDLGLFAVESLTDREFARRVAEKMEYPYYFGNGPI